jgi:hypothetical protein
MADPDPSRIRAHFRRQAEACDQLGSPFTSLLCRILADSLDRSTATGSRILDWPGHPTADALSLRLCGALHRLVLTHSDATLEMAYPPNATDEASLRTALHAAFNRCDDYLCAALDSPPQTNEIARSAMLFPGFMAIARQYQLPLRIHEIGSSAGLNLLFDRFHYRYGDIEVGEPASPVRLAPEVKGEPPVDGRLTVMSRQGSDIAPVDITDEAQRLRLRSFVWADQTLRLQRLDAAIDLMQQERFGVVRQSAGDFVRHALSTLPGSGTVFVLFHSIMWQYMPVEERGRIEKLLASAGASDEAPIAWLRMEPLDARQPHATLSVTTWPGGETRRLAHCDYHGRWIEWLGSE